MLQIVGLIVMIIIDCYVIYTFVKKPAFLKELIQRKDWLRLVIFGVLAIWLSWVNVGWIKKLFF